MLYPTLVIALGGTGSNVIENLRRRLFLTYGSYTPENKVAYLVIDTDETNEMTRWSEGIRLKISTDITKQLMDSESNLATRLELNKWMDPDLRQSLTGDKFAQGVGGVRMLGRLAFLASPDLSAVHTRLVDTLNHLHQQRPDNQAASVKVLVVASAGGGTGSGCFLDMGYLVRQTVARMTPPISYQMEGIAAIAVPDMHPNDPKKARNSAALLHELDHFSQELHTFEARYPFGQLSADLGRNAPYPYISLVSPTYDNKKFDSGTKDSMGQLEEKIADYLYFRMTDPTGRNGLDARLRDLGEVWNIVGKDNKGYPNRYMTFGVSLQQYPSGLLKRITECRAYEEFVRLWLKEAQDRTDRLDLQRIARGGALWDSFHKDLDELKGWLGLKADFDTKERGTGGDSLYTKLTISPQQPLDMKLQAALAQGRVDEQFSYKGERYNLIPDAEGFIIGVMTENKSQIVQRNDPNSTLHHVMHRFWERAFAQEFGPRYALSLLDKLGQAIEEENAFIQQVLDAHGSEGGTLSPAARANRKFEDCLIKLKKEIYQETQKALLKDERSISRRLELLISYVETWKADRLRDARQANDLLTKLDSHEFAEEARRRALDTQIGLTLKAGSFQKLETLTRGPEFGPNLPKSPAGSTDFKAFESLETEIEDLMQSATAESALALMGERNGGNWQKDCDVLAAECRPLLALHLDAEGYGELRFGAFQDRITRWMACAHQGRNGQIFDDFADALRGRNGEPDLAKNPKRVAGEIGAAKIEVLDGEEPSMVGMVFQRVAFPSRIISGYDYEDRMALLHPPGADLTTPFTQSQIESQIDPKRLEQATQTLLVAEALRRKPSHTLLGPHIEYDGTQHLYHYTPPTANLSNQATYPREFDRAVQKIASQKHAFRQMQSEIRALAADPDTRGDVKALLNGHRDALKAFRVKNPTKKYDYYEGFDLEELNYQEALDAITEWLIENELEPKGNHPWAKLNDENVWICGNCRRPQSKDRPEPTPGCKYCQHGN